MATNKIFKHNIIIEEHHLDSFGHVNNAKYLELLEEARWSFLAAYDINPKSIHKSGIGPVVLEINLKFLKELLLGQTITVESQMLSFEKMVGIMQQNIKNNLGELCSEAKLTFGLFDMRERKLVFPPQEWLEAMGIDLDKRRGSI